VNADEGEFLRDQEILRRHQVDDCEKLIRWYFPPPAHTRAVWVAWQVSQMHPGDMSKTGENLWGLFHIDPMSVGLPEREGWRLLDPVRNVAAAFKLYARYGWSVFGVDLPDLPEAFDDKGEPH